MMVKTYIAIRLEEEVAEIVGFRYIFRIETDDGYNRKRDIFTNTILDLLQQTDWDQRINWSDVEAALNRDRCWKSRVEVS